MAAKNDQSSQSLSKFSADLYQKCIEKGGNVIMSPYSIAVALSVISQGARGATFDEIMNGLHFSGDRDAIAREFAAWQTEISECFPSRSSDSLKLTVANKMYVKSGYKLSPEFQVSVEKNFHSEVELINFGEKTSAATTINDWVKVKTNKKITNIISESDRKVIGALSRLVAVNTVYFKGQWVKRFKRYKTKSEPFWINQTESIDVKMMHLTDRFKFGVFNELDAIGLEMYYSSTSASKISFLILLPNTRTGLEELEAKLKDVNLANLTARMKQELVAVSLPKFCTEFQIDMVGPLQKMGISKLFNKKTADLGDLLADGEPQLHVSSVVHKVYIEVNEEGTEAFAVSRSKMAGAASVKPIPTFFIAEHPFFYAIISDGSCNLPLFWGSLRSPKLTAQKRKLPLPKTERHWSKAPKK